MEATLKRDGSPSLAILYSAEKGIRDGPQRIGINLVAITLYQFLGHHFPFGACTSASRLHQDCVAEL
ncbi:unnamed protein product [Bursaphelenchus okinawaensis]|uniref:Uncharacterized protein n=1 Tax=Bursaphelenchus okinawaensis TaxID=465554 RepID=A0A811KJB2_9BILA|nr:unnamed protein product [Bursaphelenchus okinawaensis]CAG9104075.1 unnamed protein product [Bursaphelenchus okinawaensis]